MTSLPEESVVSAPQSGFLSQEPSAGSGRWNMAVDEWLLEQAISQQQLTLRFYSWQEPTLSLGYFQEKSGIELPESLSSLPRVRRLTGGGAILHDRELTYSLSIPATHPLASTPVELYGLFHTLVINGLKEQNVLSSMRGEEQAALNGAFLCFFRGDRHDVLINGHKILGSAQRRRKGAILQHGSLILKASSFATEILGVEDLADVVLDSKQLINSIIQQTGNIASSWQAADQEIAASLSDITAIEERY